MFCKNCGSSVKDDDLFCPSCGNKVEKEEATDSVAEPNNNVPNQPMYYQPPQKSGKKGLIITIIILLVLILLGVGAFFLFFNKDDKPNGVTPNGGNGGGNNPPTVDIGDVEYTNYKVKIDMKMVAMGISTTSTSDGVVDEVHQKEYLKSKVSVIGMEVETDSYTDFTAGYTYTKDSLSGNWTKSDAGASQTKLNTLNKLIKSKGKSIGTNKYELTITKDDLMKVYNADLSQITITGDIKVTVTTDGTHVIKSEYDFSDLVDEVETFTVVIDYSDFGNAGDVTIPSEAYNS